MTTKVCSVIWSRPRELLQQTQILGNGQDKVTRSFHVMAHTIGNYSPCSKQFVTIAIIYTKSRRSTGCAGNWKKQESFKKKFSITYISVLLQLSMINVSQVWLLRYRNISTVPANITARGRFSTFHQYDRHYQLNKTSKSVFYKTTSRGAWAKVKIQTQIRCT